jgi:hypothetical protein
MKPFEMYTDASTMQLGAVITQDNRLIAIFSRRYGASLGGALCFINNPT